MGKRLITVLFGLYFVMAGLIDYIAPNLSPADVAHETRSGFHCEADSIVDMLLWPAAVYYYWGGGFQACLKHLHEAGPNDVGDSGGDDGRDY